jgi:hypothetical protein
VDQSRVDRAVLETETAYICDPECRTVEHWHSEILEPYQKTLEWTRAFAIENRWRERRQAFWRGVQANWLRQKQTALLESRTAELAEAQDLRHQIFQMIKPKTLPDGTTVFPIQARSYEGMVRVWIQLGDMIAGERDSLLNQLDPMLGRVEAELRADEQKPQLPFSGEEMRQIAHGMLRDRRERRREEMQIEDEIDDRTAESGTEKHQGGVEGADRSGGADGTESVDS